MIRLSQDRGARRRVRRLAVPALLAALWAGAMPAQGQVVRGVVTERTTRVPIPGVLVTLVPADSAAGQAPLNLTALTDARGEYGIRAGAAGRYRVDAKRIGV